MNDKYTELQNLISAINYDKAKDSNYIEQSNGKLLQLNKIKKLTLENDLFYCSQTEYSNNIKNKHGLITNHLFNNYDFTLKNKKTLFFQLIKECLIEEIKFYFNHKKQVFIDIGKLVRLMYENKINLVEKQYIKLNDTINKLATNRPQRSNQFKTVQEFKKWLEPLIPTNIDNIEVRKDGNEYLISSLFNISIPFEITSIKGLPVKLINIDDKQHLYYNPKYQLINYKHKQISELDKTIDELSYKIVVKQESHKTIYPKGLQKGKGSTKRTGKVSKRGIERVIGIPKDTLGNWEKCNEDNYRKRLLKLLENYTEDELQHMVNESLGLKV